MLFSKDRVRYFELVLSLMLFVGASVVAFYGYFSAATVSIYLAISLVFAAHAVLYTLDTRTGAKARYGMAMHAATVAMVLLAVAYIVAVPALFDGLFLGELAFFTNSAFYFVLLLPVALLAFFGGYLVSRKDRRARAVGVILLAAMITIMLYVFVSGKVVLYYKIDDETVLQFFSAWDTVKGLNPYATSAFGALFNNASTSGVSITTNGQIVSVIDYPALYFLSFLPFFFLAQPSIYNLQHYDVVPEAALFITVLLLAIVYLTDRKNPLAPQIGMFVLLAMLVRYVASITTYLMLALILVAYFRLDKRYSWLLLGLCAALQEQLWLPIVFLVAYSFNNYGTRKGLSDLCGILLVFLLINGYFIALSPSAFFANVAAPIGKYLVPEPVSPAGYIVLEYLHTSIGVCTALFGISAIALLLVFLRLNDKRFVPLFSLIPFLFLPHGLFVYYIFFGLFMLLVMHRSGDAKGLGSIGKVIKARQVALLYAPIAVLLALSVGLIYASHVQYASQFGVSAYGYNFAVDNATHTTTYTLDISHGSMQNHTVFLAVQGLQALEPNPNSPGNYTPNLEEVYGYINQSIVPNPYRCGSQLCEVDVNRITLANGTGSQAVNVTLHWFNATSPVTAAATEIYNGRYFYVTNATGPLR